MRLTLNQNVTIYEHVFLLLAHFSSLHNLQYLKDLIHPEATSHLKIQQSCLSIRPKTQNNMMINI